MAISRFYRFDCKHSFVTPCAEHLLTFIDQTNHVIAEWCNGPHKKEKLNVDQQLPVFRRYLKLLTDMNERQPHYLEELCGSIHDDAQ